MVTSPPRINPTYTLVPYTTAVRFGVAFAVASGFVERMLCGGLLGISLLHICMRLFDHGGRGFCGRRGADGNHGCGLDRDRCGGDDVLELGLGLCLLLGLARLARLAGFARRTRWLGLLRRLGPIGRAACRERGCPSV